MCKHLSIEQLARPVPLVARAFLKLEDILLNLQLFCLSSLYGGTVEDNFTPLRQECDYQRICRLCWCRSIANYDYYRNRKFLLFVPYWKIEGSVESRANACSPSLITKPPCSSVTIGMGRTGFVNTSSSIAQKACLLVRYSRKVAELTRYLVFPRTKSPLELRALLCRSLNTPPLHREHPMKRLNSVEH